MTCNTREHCDSREHESFHLRGPGGPEEEEPVWPLTTLLEGSQAVYLERHTGQQLSRFKVPKFPVTTDQLFSSPSVCPRISRAGSLTDWMVAVGHSWGHGKVIS